MGGRRDCRHGGLSTRRWRGPGVVLGVSLADRAARRLRRVRAAATRRRGCTIERRRGRRLAGPGSSAAASPGGWRSAAARPPRRRDSRRPRRSCSRRSAPTPGSAARRGPTNLPPKSTAGIECVVGSNLVDRVGVYAFATPQDALAAYIARMAGYGVALRSGDCSAGKAGDQAWTPGDGPDEGGDQPWRTGCFLDENGKANVRAICGLEAGSGEVARYIGVLGASTKIKPLLDWTNAYEDGVETPVPSPPGICMTAAAGGG